VLQNISQRFKGGKQKLLQSIRKFKQDYAGDLTLARFSEIMEIPLHRIYGHGLMWFELLEEAEGNPVNQDDVKQRLARAMASVWLATDSLSYFSFLRESLVNDFSHRDDESARHWCLMCYYDLFEAPTGSANHAALAQKMDSLIHDSSVKKEVSEFLNLRIRDHEAIEQNTSLSFPTALRLHGRYTRSQVIVGLGMSNLSRRFPSREGVLLAKDLNTEAFFVTLDKSGMEFNPSTMYNDYFINTELFHWQSQNATSPESPKGQSYIHHAASGKKILLFVREANRDEDELTMGFVCCGLLQYVSHEGSKPMSITWRMEVPPPAMLLQEGRKLAIG
jgi:hypothetical protein